MRQGCRNQTEGKISCPVVASLHLHTHLAHSHSPTPVISAGVLYTCVISVYLCVCFLLVYVMYSSPCHSFPPIFLSFSESLPPCFDLFLLFSPTRSQSQKQAHAPIYPPTHAVGTGKYPTSSAVWCGVMQRNTKIGAAPLPNDVSMATKGARPCDAVSNQHWILNLSKDMSCV